MKITKEQEVLINRIMQLCREKRMTYYKLSYESTVPLSTVANILSGKTTNPGIFTIMKICDGLDISLDVFFGTEEFHRLYEVGKTENE